MREAIDDVRQFHELVSAPNRSKPELLPADDARVRRLAERLRELIRAEAQDVSQEQELLQRALLSLEELVEWLEAHWKKDLIAAADAWGDRAYALLGDAVSSGLPGAEIFAEVHRSNMTKSPVEPGRRGKAIKGPSYTPPCLDAILEQALHDQPPND